MFLNVIDGFQNFYSHKFIWRLSKTEDNKFLLQNKHFPFSGQLPVRLSKYSCIKVR